MKMIHSTFCGDVPILEKKVLVTDQVSMWFVRYKTKKDYYCYSSVYKLRRRQKDGEKSTHKKSSKLEVSQQDEMCL